MRRRRGIGGRKRALLGAILAFALPAALPATASAGVPEKRYACYGETSTFIGYLKIKSDTKYNYLGGNGKYRFRSAGKVLKFRSGPLDDWVGRLFKQNGDPAIQLVTDRAGGQTVNCFS